MPFKTSDRPDNSQRIAEINREAQKSSQSVIGSIARLSWIGVNYGLSKLEGISSDPDENLKSKSAHELRMSVPIANQNQLLGIKTLPELQQKTRQINGVLEAQANLQKELGSAGTFATVMAASVLDPTNLLSGSILHKFNKSIKLYDSLSTGRKATVLGAEGAIENAAGEAEMQYHGTEEYEDVAIAAAAGFILVGGVSYAADALDNASVKLQDGKIRKYVEGDVKLDTNLKEAKVMLDEIAEMDKVTPVKNFAVNVLDKISGGGSKLFASNGRIMVNRGGIEAVESSKIDSTYVPLQDAEGRLISNEGFTAQDIMYKQREHLYTSMHHDRLAFGDYNKKLVESKQEPIEITEYNNIVMRKYRQYENQYREAKNEVSKNITEEQLVKFRDEAKLAIQKKIKDENPEATTKEFAEEVEASTDRIDAEANHLKNEYIRSELDKNTDLKVKGNEPIDRSIQSKVDYYTNMHSSMLKANMESARSMYPAFYSHIEYNKKAMVNNPKEARKSIIEAITNSPEYKQALVDQQKLIDTLKNADSKVDIGDAEELADINLRIDHLKDQQKEIEDNLEIAESLMRGDIDDVEMLMHQPKNYDVKKLKKSKFNSIESEILSSSSTEASEKLLLSIEDLAETNKLWQLAGRPKIKAGSKLGEGSAGRYNIETQLIELADGFGKQGDILTHELFHAAILHAMNANPKFRKSISDLMDEIISVRATYTKGKTSTPAKYTKEYSSMTDKQLHDYFTVDPDEFISELMSNGKLVQYLNQVEYVGKKIASKKQHAFLREIIQRILKFMSPLFKNVDIEPTSVMSEFLNRMDVGIVNTKIPINKSKIYAENNRLSKIYAEARAKSAKYYKRSMTTGKSEHVKQASEWNKRMNIARENYLESINVIRDGAQVDIFKSPEYIDQIKTDLDEIIKDLETKLIDIQVKGQANKDQLVDEITNLHELQKLPSKQAKGTVQKFINMDKDSIRNELAEFSLNDKSDIPNQWKGRTLTVNQDILSRDGFLLDDSDAMAKYHYRTSGKIATQQALGFQRESDYRTHLEAQKGISKSGVQMLTEMFGDVQGTRMLSEDPDSWSRLFARGATNFNYTTMGGQFAIYAIAEAATGIARTGFGYVGELIPATKTVIKMYKNVELEKVEEASMIYANATDLLEASNRSRQGDAYTPDDLFAGERTTIGQKTVKGLSDLSRQFYRWSGLEGITTITKVALPKALTQRIFKEFYRNGDMVSNDLLRFGFSKEFTRKVMDQPVKWNDKGNIVDFNFKEWDPDIAERYNVYISRAVRETIVSVDGTRLPSWMGDANTSVLAMLTKQFMSFSAVAHERLLLSGMNDSAANVILGSFISGIILGVFQLSSQEIALRMGLLKKEDQRFDMNTEKGRAKFFEYIGTRQSFSGNFGQLYDFINDISNPGQSVSAATQVAGGITISRILQTKRAIGEAIDGKYGTKTQTATIKGIIPYNNLVGLDYMNKHIMALMITDGY